MILGIKCEGCKMWTRVKLRGLQTKDRFILNHPVFTELIMSQDEQPYYCDECEDNVTYHTTKARITTQ